MPDAGALYQAEYTVDVSDLEPQIACPCGEMAEYQFRRTAKTLTSGAR